LNFDLLLLTAEPTDAAERNWSSSRWPGCTRMLSHGPARLENLPDHKFIISS